MKSKKQRATRKIPTQIQELHNQVEQWRRTRPCRGPMPESLWALAADGARQHGVARVARWAGLDYYSLKERLEASTGQKTSRPEKQPAFVELWPGPSRAVMDCTVEFEHPRGARMRIHLQGATAPDLTSLAGSFWSTVS